MMAIRKSGPAVFTVLCLLMFCRAATAQGLLKQLEEKVRSSLESTAAGDPNAQPPGNPTPGTPAPNNALRPEVLPAPQPGGTSGPGGLQLSSPAGTPANPGPLSILEPPATVSNNLGNEVMPVPAGEAAPTYLGIETEPNLGGGIGVRVVAVTQDSPAWRAGFRIGDVIQAVDGFAISDLDVLADRLSRKRAGESVKMLVLRAGRNTELTAVLQDASIAQRVHGFVPQVPAAATGPAYFGVSVADLSAAFRLQFGIKVFRGAAVTNVAKNSPAHLAGIEAGEVITKVNGRTIEASQDIVNWIATARPGDVAQLTVLHGQQPRQVEVALTTDPRYAAALPAGIDMGSQTSEVTALRTEVRQLRDELEATRAQLNQLARQIEELSKK